MVIDVRVGEEFVDDADQILPSRNAADWAGQHVVEHQSRNREFGKRSAEGFLDHAVHAAAHEHAAAFDVNRAHGVREQHDAQDEPRCGFADELLSFTAGVIGRRRQVVEYDSRGTPERNEGKHRRSSDKYLCYGTHAAWRKCGTCRVRCHILS